MALDFSIFKSSLPYLRSFKGKTFVIKLGGELIANKAALENLGVQISILDSIGIRLVVVHGGGAQATELAKRLGVENQFVAGRRVTSSEMLEVTKMTFAGSINIDITNAFERQGIRTVGLSGVDSDLVQVKQRPPVEVVDPSIGTKTKVNYGLVGDISGVDTRLTEDLLRHGYVPVICSLAADNKGQILNINADSMATELAIHLKAAKLLFVTAVDGVMRDLNDTSTLVSLLDLNETESLLSSGGVSGGMIPKLNNCLRALKAGVSRVHIVGGLSPDSLLRELFTNEGCGTMLLASN